MKSTTFVKTDNGYNTGTYNINSYTPLDAVIAFLIAIVSMELVGIGFRYLINNTGMYAMSYYILSTISILIAQFVIFLIAFFYSKCRRVSYLNGGGFTFRFDWVNILFGAMLIIGIDLLFTSVHTQFGEDLLRIMGSSMDDYLGGVPTDISGIDVLFALLQIYILTPLLPSIAEEGLYRGIIMRGLSQFGKVFAVIVSSMMFAFMHDNPVQILLQFIAGLSIGSIVMLTRNYAIGCAMHFISNFSITWLAVFGEMADSYFYHGSYLYDAISIVIGTIFLMVSLTYFVKMYLAKYKRQILDKPNSLGYYDYLKYSYVETDDVDERGEKVYKKVYWSEIAVGEYTLAGSKFAYKGNIYTVNKPTKKALLSKIMIAVSLVLSVVLIFVI